MSPAVIIFLFSSDRALRVCALATVTIVLIPMLVVLTITQVGAQAVTDVLLPAGDNHNPTSISTSYGSIELEQPAIWPLGGVITQEFGVSNLPYQVAHTGIDIASPNGISGNPVRAILPGTVTFSGRALLSGNIEVHVNHGQGLESWYAHLDSASVVEGQEVAQGQLLGLEGSSGWATGVHLHLEVRLFHIPVNPRVLLGNNAPPMELP